MKRIMLWVIVSVLLVMAVPTWAQDTADCGADDIKNQMNELVAAYLSAQAKATEADDALAAANDLQMRIAALTAGCADGTAEATTEAVDSGMPTEGKWSLTWSAEEQACPGTDFVTGATNREVLLKVDTEQNRIFLEDIFRLSPGEFILNPDGTYHFLRNLTADDGSPYSFDYVMTAIDATSISGKAIDYYSWIDCNLVNPFEMKLLDENVICIVGPDQSANLRSGPGTSFDRFGTLEGGKTYDVVGYSNSADGFRWWQLSSGGWVRDDLVIEAGRCEDVPEVTA